MKAFVTFMSLVTICCTSYASNDEALIVDGDKIKISFNRMNLDEVGTYWTGGNSNNDLNKQIEAVSNDVDYSQCEISGWMPNGYFQGPATITRFEDGRKRLRIALIPNGSTQDFGHSYALCQSMKEFSIKMLNSIFGPNVDITVSPN